MALAGSLKEFGLADILQLISYQKKTGNLTLKGRFDTVRVLFKDGNIVAAESAKRKTASRLGRVLLRKGAVTVEALTEAIEEQKESRLRLGTILVRKGLVTKEQVMQVLTDQITELIVQLFSWTEGKYEFTPVAVPIDKYVPLSIDTQGLMMDSLRIFDEWSVFKGRITQNSVFVRTGKPEEGLDSDSIDLLNLVDGESDLTRVADQYGLEAFETAKRLNELMESGHIAMKEAVSAEEAPVAPEAGPKKIPGLSLLVLAVALAALALSVVGYMARADGGLERVRAAEALEGLRFELQVRRHMEGRYPDAVDDRDAWGNPYVYEKTDGGFTLFSAGPDGKAGTADDIR